MDHKKFNSKNFSTVSSMPDMDMYQIDGISTFFVQKTSYQINKQMVQGNKIFQSKITFQMTKQTKLRKYNNNNNRCQNVRKIFTVRALLTLKICSKSSSIRGVVILRGQRPSNFWLRVNIHLDPPILRQKGNDFFGEFRLSPLTLKNMTTSLSYVVTCVPRFKIEIKP